MGARARKKLLGLGGTFVLWPPGGRLLSAVLRSHDSKLVYRSCARGSDNTHTKNALCASAPPMSGSVEEGGRPAPKRGFRQVLDQWRVAIAIFVTAIIVLPVAIWGTFLGTKGPSTLALPGGGNGLNAYANPTWSETDFSSLSTGATAANWSFHLIRFGPTRVLRVVAYALMLSNDFIYFPLGTFAAGDLPAVDKYVPDYLYQTFTASCLFAPTTVAQCTMLIFQGGDALIGLNSYGVDGPFVDMTIFPAQLIGSFIFGLSSAGTWTATFNQGPAVNVGLAAAGPNNTAPITAAAFGARWQSIHAVTPIGYPTPLPTPPPFNNQSQFKK
jgi:hypothetical protein